MTPYDTIRAIAAKWSQAERVRHLAAVASFMIEVDAATSAPTQTAVGVEVVIAQGGVRSAKHKTERTT